jgi:hypothetical protein
LKASTTLLIAALSTYACAALATSGSIGGGKDKNQREAETYNAQGKSTKTQSEACAEAKAQGTRHAKGLGAIDFTFGACDCSARKLEGPELWAAKTRDGRAEISEHVCNVDTRIKLPK